MREGHVVGLVAHAQALPTVLPGVLERVANDALHALSGVDVLLKGRGAHHSLRVRVRPAKPSATPVHERQVQRHDLRAWSMATRLQGSPPGICGQDRKSTRLNSSHGYISYAVFCLKKKNTSLYHTSKIHFS